MTQGFDNAIEIVCPRRHLLVLSAVVVALLAGHARPAWASLEASATIGVEQISPGEYQYDITLNDTGTTSIETFWYAWVPGKGFLASDPSNIVSPAGWSAAVTETYAIQWTTTTAPLASDSSLLGFQFTSPDTPAEVFGDSVAFPSFPVGTSVVYETTPLSTPSFQFVATPEPSSWVLALLGALGALWAACCRRHCRPVLAA